MRALGCEGSTLWLIGPGTGHPGTYGGLGMGGGPAAACALVELAPLLCHCLLRSRLFQTKESAPSYLCTHVQPCTLSCQLRVIIGGAIGMQHQ
jgi:hypothetical protein